MDLKASPLSNIGRVTKKGWMENIKDSLKTVYLLIVLLKQNELFIHTRSTLSVKKCSVELKWLVN